MPETFQALVFPITLWLLPLLYVVVPIALGIVVGRGIVQ